MNRLIALYLLVIVVANLFVAEFGPSAAVIGALVLIGPNLTTRDALHEQWRGKNLRRNMLILIGAGSVISALLNTAATQIAIASFVAFATAGLGDTLVYEGLRNRPVIVRMNASNVVSALLDSVVFAGLAFGFPLLWSVIIGQFAAKVAGGLVWSAFLARRVAPQRVT